MTISKFKRCIDFYIVISLILLLCIFELFQLQPLNKLISKATIDIVFETARVEEVVGDFVQLKRAGSNFKGLSPFSDERSPSFMVSPAKGIWKDFSTGKGGNSVGFLDGAFSFYLSRSHSIFGQKIQYRN